MSTLRVGALLLALVLSACESDIGDPTWATVTGERDRGSWGCSTTLRTADGMVLAFRPCRLQVGDSVCIQPKHRWDPARDQYWAEPARGCAGGGA